MNTKTKTIALAGVFSSLVFLLAMTPIGLIPLGFINLTVVHIPVIIGTIVLGKRMGLILGGAFGLASTLAAFGMSLAAQSALAATLLSYSPLSVIIMCIAPRLLIPITTYYSYEALKKHVGHMKIGKKRLSQNGALAISSVIGSLTNTIGYLGLMGLFFAMFGNWGKFSGIFTVSLIIGASCEAIVAALVAVPVVTAIGALKETEEIRKVTKNIPDEEPETLPLSKKDEGVAQADVAVLPNTNTLLPSLDDTYALIDKKACAYLNSGAVVLADALFLRMEQNAAFDRVRLGTYIAMRYTEAGQYIGAANKLLDVFLLLKPDSALDDITKKTILGIINIIHTANMNSAGDNDMQHLRTERIFAKLIALIDGEAYALAAQMLKVYISQCSLA